MTRGAPFKKGLEYFPKYIDFYDDFKMIDLMDEYGPLGVMVYEVILTKVFSNGYFLNLSKEDLVRHVVRTIGNRWAKKDVVYQVIDYCADIGLLHDDLLSQGIITSESIQRQYYEVAIVRLKRQQYTDEYWLIESEKKLGGQPLLNEPKNQYNSEIKGINSELNQNNTELNTPKRKGKRKDKEKEINTICPELQNVASEQQELAKKEPVYQLLLNDNSLHTIYEDDMKQYRYLYPAVDIDSEVKKMIGWIDANPKNRKTKGGVKRFVASWLARAQNSAPVVKFPKSGTPNKFHNFEQRDTNYDEVVKKGMTDWMEG